MKILVLNCGSSSIKYQILDMNEEPDLLAKGLLERIGLSDSELQHQPKGKEKYVKIESCPDHTKGIDIILKILLHPEHGVIREMSEIEAVGHRVVHGGEKFSSSIEIDLEVVKMIEECIPLAPLHNPANLKGIYAVRNVMPEVPQCAVFDTAFHHTMPAHAYMYALPYELYEKYKIRRYGFHGTSHGYVAPKACSLLRKNIEELKIITCHLGNGASVAAIKNGKSIDTSMGLTPVEGLMMGTRTGDMDLGALLFLMEKENLTTKKVSDVVNKKSGIFGVSGVSFDMRDVEKEADSGNQRAKLALVMFTYRVKKYIGAYAAAMGGVDLIVFTGGIGENACNARREIMTDMEFLGVDFDYEINSHTRCMDAVLTKPGSKVTVMAVTTNEELVIAMESQRIFRKDKTPVSC